MTVILSGAQRSRRIPRRYLKGNTTGSLDFARDDGRYFAAPGMTSLGRGA
jgi:hypothetical protein